MITHEEKEYLNCRINRIMELLVEVVREMGKWETEPLTESRGESK